MKLIVGLGNPGKKYEDTRHNAGAWWVERLARSAKATLREEGKFRGRVTRLPATESWLLLPDTFMNHSGRAVVALATFYKIAPADILVAHDELDLPPGTVKLKFGGGSGGHNGLKDIGEQLGSNEFWRLRLGIGHPRTIEASEQEVADYVLHPPRAEEHPLIENAIARSLEVWPLLALGNTEAAMLRLHTKEKNTNEP
jgi:PTH1 family peptidyl-tRNA hydrolase